jgi:MFS transporter, DHA1 family, inner membrane transport protein
MSNEARTIASVVLVVWISGVAACFINFQPLIVGAFVTFRGVSESDSGLVASVNMLGMLLGMMLCAARIHRWNLSTVFVVALIVMGIGDALTPFVPKLEYLYAVRLLTGIGAGIALSGVATFAAGSAQPDRVFGMTLVAMGLMGGIGLLALPYIFDTFSFRVGMLAVASLSFITLALFRYLPGAPDERATTATHAPAPSALRTIASKPTLLLLGVLGLFYVANNGVWAYYERIGVNVGVDAKEIGMALSAGTLAAMFGGIFAATVGDRLGRMIPVGAGLTMAIGGALILHTAFDFTTLLISVMLFLGSTGLVTPYVLGALAAREDTGRLAIVGTAAIYGGMFLGPALAAWLVRSGDYATLVIASVALCSVSLALAIAAFVTDPRKPGVTTNPEFER